MKITLPFAFTDSVVPPRCRKPRNVSKTANITLTIHEVSSQEAPVAIIERGRRIQGNRTVPYETSYRWYRGKLYVQASFRRTCQSPYERQTAKKFLTDPYPYNLLKINEDRKYESLAECRKHARAWAHDILFVEGQRWAAIDEPRYTIYTFGLGHNHGIGWGTSLSNDNHYNSNIGHDRYFRIDEFNEAVREATRIATARGDTKSLPVVEKQKPARFEVLIPDAIRLRPSKQHGKGNAFTNKIEEAIQAAGNPVVAGAVAIAMAHSVLATER